MDQQLLDLEIVTTLRELGGPTGDDFARELFALFCEQSDSVTRELGAAAARGDSAKVRYYAHRLKGSAANLGAHALAAAAHALELVAVDGGADGTSLAHGAAAVQALRERSVAALAPLLG